MTTRQKKTLLLLGDLLMLQLALYLSLLIRYGLDQVNSQFYQHWPHFIFIFFIFIISSYINQYYDLNLKVDSKLFFKRLINTTIVSSLISIAYFYLSISPQISPKTNLALFISIFLFLSYLWHHVFSAFNTLKTEIGLAIVGDNEKTRTLEQEIEKNPGANYQLKLIIRDRKDFSELARQITNNNIKTVVLADEIDPKATGPFLLSLLPQQISVYSYPDFYESLVHKIPVEALNTDWFLDNLKEGNKQLFQLSKRVVDIVLASFILLISACLWPFIILAIKLESKGPPFFTQTRLGHRGKKFAIIKFRTMTIENNDHTITKVNDKRITKVGYFLRKTRLDELPQTINIIKGEMSFIGPRPERPELSLELEEAIPFYNVRLTVKPGLTGLDQVSGEYHSASKADTLKKLQHDLYYIKNRSFYLDALIFLKTIATVFKGYGR